MKRQHIFLPAIVISLLLLQLTFAAPPRYEVIDLGTLGGNWSAASSINDEGQIVGWARKSVGFRHATLFDPTGGGKNLDLGTLGFVPPPPSPLPFNRPYGAASSINDNGQIVGWAIHSSGSDRAAIFDATGYGNNIHLGTLSGYNYSWAASINGNGQIVGVCAAVSRWFPTRNRATLFDPTGSGNNIDLDTLGGRESYACGINNIGQIVGGAENSSGDPHATLFDHIRNGNNIDLAPLDIASGAYSINDNGQIVGEIFKSGYWHATLFDTTGNGNNIDLGTLGGDESCAISINERGQIVGWSQKGTGILDSYATLFDPTGGSNNIDLNTLIDPACDLTLTSALSINNSGWIVGTGYYIYDGFPHFSGPHAYLLVPKPPTIYYVDADAAGANDGSSWADAYSYLQDALSVAYSGDEIRVAQGIYKPDQGTNQTPGDREATFQLKNGVTLKGGYAGTDTPDPNARNIELYETILSGDLNGDDGPNFANNGENSYHVVTGSRTDETAVLDGFTITGGNANGSRPYDLGGGMYNDAGSPTLTSCTFSGNSAGHGGGMYNNGRPTLTSCTFSENSAGHCGGGMYNSGSAPVLTNCTFSGNSASHNGGGMYNSGSCSPTLTNCIFIGNSAGRWGGGMYGYGSICSPTLTNCIFIGNLAGRDGGGMCNSNSSTTLTSCTFSGNSAGWDGGGMFNLRSDPVLTNCTFSGNSAGQHGGGIFCCQGFPTFGHGHEPPPEIANGTIVGNADTGIFYDSSDGDIIITNCIIWGNEAPDGPEIYLDSYSNAWVSYSDVQGGWLGEGNIDNDPCFVSPGYWDANSVWVDGDYHLLPDSPCINAGDPNYVAEPNETDLDGRPRIIGSRIDMGAYESPIFAEVRIVPRTINLASKGNWITCYIYLPEEYNLADIEPNSIVLEDEVQAESLQVNEQEQVAIAKFSRSDVQSILSIGQVELTITGQLTDGTIFEGTDTIKVIDKAGKN